MDTKKQLSLLACVLLGAAAGESAPAPQEELPSPDVLMEQTRPGAEHGRLGRLEGEWQVTRRVAGQGAGETEGVGSAATILDGRFLVVDFSLGADGAEESYRYTLGFDRRHDEYSIVVMDTSGTYFVTARGAEADGTIRMAGTDDDPMMASMGYARRV